MPIKELTLVYAGVEVPADIFEKFYLDGNAKPLRDWIAGVEAKLSENYN